METMPAAPLKQLPPEHSKFNKVLFILIIGIIIVFFSPWVQKIVKKQSSKTQPEPENLVQLSPTIAESVFKPFSTASLQTSKKKLVYNIVLINAGNIEITDSKGNTVRPEEIVDVTDIDIITESYGSSYVRVMFPLGNNYQINYSHISNKPEDFPVSIFVYIAEGEGNNAPIVVKQSYENLVFPSGTSGNLVITQDSIEPLRIKRLGTEQFLEMVQPHEYADVIDAIPPSVTISADKTISATDSSGVKAVYYSQNQELFQLYKGPLAGNVTGLYAIAVDNAGVVSLPVKSL